MVERSNVQMSPTPSVAPSDLEKPWMDYGHRMGFSLSQKDTEAESDPVQVWTCWYAEGYWNDTLWSRHGRLQSASSEPKFDNQPGVKLKDVQQQPCSGRFEGYKAG